MANSELRSKFGYFTYSDMLQKIQEQKINAYDLIYCKDKNIQYIITPDLVPIDIGSNISVYDSVAAGVADIRTKTSTYVGQVVTVLTEGVYRVYIVNKDENGEYVLIPSQDSMGNINYDNLQNAPIINKSGTLSNPVRLSSLDDGIYKVSGYYSIVENGVAKDSEAGIIVVRYQDGVKIISSIEVINYKYTNGIAIEDKYVTNGLLQTELQQTTLDNKKYIEDNVYPKITEVEEKVPSVETVDINFNIF